MDLYIYRRRYAVVCIYPCAPTSAYSVACGEKGWWYLRSLVRSYTLGKYILISTNGKIKKKHKTTNIQKRDPKKFFGIDKLRGFTHRCTSGSVPNLPYTAMLGVYLVISPTFSFSLSQKHLSPLEIRRLLHF